MLFPVGNNAKVLLTVRELLSKVLCASRSLWTPLWQEAIKKLSKTPQGRGDKRELQNAHLEKLGRQEKWLPPHKNGRQEPSHLSRCHANLKISFLSRTSPDSYRSQLRALPLYHHVSSHSILQYEQVFRLPAPCRTP